MKTFQRRRDARNFREPTELEHRAAVEADEALDIHFAEVDAEEVLLEHLAAWRAGEARLKVGVHTAACLRKGGDDCVCSAGEVTVFVQDPADRLDDGRACPDPYWSEMPR